MKLEIDVPDEYVEILKRTREIPEVIVKHLGHIPMTYPDIGRDLGIIRDMCVEWEFRFKKEIFDSNACRPEWEKVFNNTELVMREENEDQDGFPAGFFKEKQYQKYEKKAEK